MQVQHPEQHVLQHLLRHLSFFRFPSHGSRTSAWFLPQQVVPQEHDSSAIVVGETVVSTTAPLRPHFHRQHRDKIPDLRTGSAND